MRYYKGQPIELLAPAGTFDIFKSVIHANCDAVYFGGSILNMRMIRKGYNFSNEEIEEAIKIAHDLGKKVYITVNNLFSHEDLAEAVPYLNFLESVQPDALIIQDFALFQLAKELKLTMELHSSVMMNVHNLDMIQALEEMGVSRVVTSREMSLADIQTLKTKTKMAFEYFAHGDMCVAHGAQCIYSGMLFGMSSNRGRCLKPCRWPYDLSKDGQLYAPGYPLAVKDMSLFGDLPALIQSGVTSFKLEGRMRDEAFITTLVNLYGQAIDDYLASPETFDPSEGQKYIYENRKRDLSTGYAFGKPGLDNINSRYEGTGKFYSTGKVFSTPTEELSIQTERTEAIKRTLTASATDSRDKPKKLTVKVNRMDQALVCLDKQVDILYLSSEQSIQDRPFTLEDYHRLIKNKGNTKLYLALPKMITDDQFEKFDSLLMTEQLPFDGLLCTNIGAIKRYGHLNYTLRGDTGLNCYNHLALSTYMEAGIAGVTVSLESPLKDIRALGLHSPCPLEITVHGRPTVMYLEHDLYDNTNVFTPIKPSHNQHVDDSLLTLRTPVGEYPVIKDIYNRNHLLASKEICYIDILDALHHTGYSYFRIEASLYSQEELATIVDAYQAKLKDDDKNISLTPVSAGYSYGALAFD